MWDLHRSPLLPIEVIVPGQRGGRQKRITSHRMRLHAGETVLRDGLRVTAPARTIIDLAGTLTSRSLREVVERAQDVRRFDAVAIRATLTRLPGRPGRARSPT